MKLGFAVKVLGQDLPSHDTRRWQSNPHLKVSLERLRSIFDYLVANDIRMYRMASALAPYASHPDLPHFRRQVDDCLDELQSAGSFAKKHGIRLSTHPGQYTVLNSESSTVMDAAVAEIEVQAELLDAMDLGPEAVVVLHAGGRGSGDPYGRFMRGFERLSDRARARLVLENDDRVFALADVVRLADSAGVPVVWDVLHHHCHDPYGIQDREALALALSTWPAHVMPKIHFSSPKTTLEEKSVKVQGRTVKRLVPPQPRAHADMVDPVAFSWFLSEIARERDFDVMLEAKGKDLALLTLRRQLHERSKSSNGGDVPAAPADSIPSGDIVPK